MLFDDLLHNSPSNPTALPRLSFTARYARPVAEVHDIADYPNLMVSGHPKDSALRFVDPPDAGPGLADVWQACICF